VPQFIQEFSDVIHALPSTPIPGPTFANLLSDASQSEQLTAPSASATMLALD
jgi:hypothetical protein